LAAARAPAHGVGVVLLLVLLAMLWAEL